nr:MAG TPA: hypothetical protein [Caudoviricetes sp.]
MFYPCLDMAKITDIYYQGRRRKIPSTTTLILT